MPVEDWIEKWTEMQTKEIERIERQHGERMDKIEKSIDNLDEKIDDLSKKMDKITEAINAKNNEHAIELAVIKTKIAAYATIASIFSAGVVAWAVNYFSK